MTSFPRCKSCDSTPFPELFEFLKLKCILNSIIKKGSIKRQIGLTAPSIVFTDRKKESKPQYPKPQTNVKLNPVKKIIGKIT